MALKMMKGFVLALAAQYAVAFPSVTTIEGRQVHLPKDKHESNTGVIKSTTFDPTDQLVHVRPGTVHEFRAPLPGQLRGPCPGLNAASNHGFLPRDGLATITGTPTGLGAAFNMGPDLAAALAVIAVALTGDYITETWSIGGAFPGSTPLLATPGGISNSHNKYESDSSVGRGDAYLHHGNAVSLVMASFNKMYNLAENYNLYHLRQHAQTVREYSIHHNPYFFSAPFAGIVATAAHEFVINFMSNHSEAVPSGYLDRPTLKSMFSVKGSGVDKHYWVPGHEEIPQNWYRRPSSNQYDLVRNNADNVISLTTYPILATFGGNTGKVNTFTGVDLADLTNGAYNSKTLLQGGNLGCFMFQFTEAVLPDELAGLVKNIQPVMNLVRKHFKVAYEKLGCGKLGKFNTGLFDKFPGYHYNPHVTGANPGSKGANP